MARPAASTELEKSLLRGLRDGALCTAARVSMGRGRTPRAPSAARRTGTKSISCGTARSGSRPERHGVPGSMTRQRPSPSWGRRTTGPHALGRRAFSLCGWRKGLIGDASMSSCTACTASTWRSLRPAWRRATGTRRAAGTLYSRTSRVHSPATPTSGTTSSAPYQGTRLQPAMALTGGPTGLALAPGLRPQLGQVGQGAGLDAGVGRSLLG